MLSEAQKERIEYYKRTLKDISRDELEESFLEVLEQLFSLGNRVSWFEGYASVVEEEI